MYGRKQQALVEQLHATSIAEIEARVDAILKKTELHINVLFKGQYGMCAQNMSTSQLSSYYKTKKCNEKRKHNYFMSEYFIVMWHCDWV